MQAVINQQPTARTTLAEKLGQLRSTRGVTFADIAVETGVSRSQISQYVNQGIRLRPEHEAALQAYVDSHSTDEEQATLPGVDVSKPVQYKSAIELYPTAEYQEAMGWCQYIAGKRKMGVLIGPPGCGKTTVLRQFAQLNPNAVLIQAWASMRMGDLMEILGRAAGVALRGSNYVKAQQIIHALQERTDLVLLIDEAEYLRKWDVDKFEVLRKIWDNTGTPVIFAGTPALETVLTRGGGRDNLAQLYRRKYEIVLKGIREPEARRILSDYNVSKEAALMLAAIAADAAHGGMGTFVEILDLCLEYAEGRQIDAAIVRAAKQYKLLY